MTKDRLQFVFLIILAGVVLAIFLHQERVNSSLKSLPLVHADLERASPNFPAHPVFMATGFDQYIAEGIGIQFEDVQRRDDTTHASGRVINHNATTVLFLKLALFADTASGCVQLAGRSEFNECASLVSRIEFETPPILPAHSQPFRVAIHTPGDTASYSWKVLLLNNASSYER